MTANDLESRRARIEAEAQKRGCTFIPEQPLPKPVGDDRPANMEAVLSCPGMDEIADSADDPTEIELYLFG